MDIRKTSDTKRPFKEKEKIMDTMNVIIFSALAYYCLRELCELVKTLKQSSDRSKCAEISRK